MLAKKRKYALIISLVVVFFAAFVVGAEQEKQLSGRELLKQMRQQQGIEVTQNYEVRIAKQKGEEAQREAEKQKALQEQQEQVLLEAQAKREAILEELRSKRAATTFTTEELLDMPVGDIGGYDSSATLGIMELIPDDALVVVRVNSFNNTVMNTNLYVAGVSPVPVALAVNNLMMQIFDSPVPQGVNMNGDFAIAVLPSKRLSQDPSLCLILPVDSFEEFVSGNSNVEEADSNGIAVMTTPLGVSLFSQNIGSYVVISEYQNEEDFINEFTLSSTQKTFQEFLGVEKAGVANSKSLWLYANPKILFENEELSKAFSTGFTSSAPDFVGDPADVVSEIESIIISFEPAADIARASIDIEAPGSEILNKYFSADSEQLAEVLMTLGGEPVINRNESLNEISGIIRITPDTDFAGKVNLLDLLRMGMIDKGLNTDAITAMSPTSKGSLFYTVNCGGDSLGINLALPKEHLIETAAAVISLIATVQNSTESLDGEQRPDGNQEINTDPVEISGSGRS